MPIKPVVFPVEQPDTLLPFLLAHISGQSRNNIKSLLARRQVAVDGKVAAQFDMPLTPGQNVAIAPPGQTAPDLPFPILFEDEDLIVINKPAGLLTIANEDEKTRTAYYQLTAWVRSKDPKARVFIVHRLDRDTSGLLVFAKNEPMKRALQDDWDKLVTKRTYMAILEGVPDEPSGTVRSFLHETKSHLVYSGGSFKGKEAVTRYEVVQRNGKYALVSIELDTGRKNQIRVHMKDMGCPVAGDDKYDAKTDPLGRLALHASELRFFRPGSKKELSFTAPVPRSFTALLRR